jgi:hypothetical protein
MSVLKVCNYYLSSSLDETKLADKFKEILFEYLADIELDSGFDLDNFVEEVFEENKFFEILSDSDGFYDNCLNEEDIDDLIDEFISSIEDEDDESGDLEEDEDDVEYDEDSEDED